MMDMFRKYMADQLLIGHVISHNGKLYKVVGLHLGLCKLLETKQLDKILKDPNQKILREI